LTTLCNSPIKITTKTFLLKLKESKSIQKLPFDKAKKDQVQKKTTSFKQIFKSSKNKSKNFNPCKSSEEPQDLSKNCLKWSQFNHTIKMGTSNGNKTMALLQIMSSAAAKTFR
jgi:hypothetical protein